MEQEQKRNKGCPLFTRPYDDLHKWLMRVCKKEGTFKSPALEDKATRLTLRYDLA